jgi:hypothetical protein
VLPHSCRTYLEDLLGRQLPHELVLMPASSPSSG